MRKGYASLVTKYVAKKVAETGHDVYVSIHEKNVPSRMLNMKVGFKPVGDIYCIDTKLSTWYTNFE